MRASDVMTKDVITVRPETPVLQVARTLLERHISGVPVVDDDGRVIGIVSEGDLMRRIQGETEGRGSWWLALFTSSVERMREFVKAHGQTARHVMTDNPITVPPTAHVGEIARLLEQHRIKRVPVVENGKPVGIVSRANLLHALAAHAGDLAPSTASDSKIREEVTARLAEAGVDTSLVNVVVRNGVVQLWGVTLTEDAEEAALVAVRTVPGVRQAESRITRMPAWVFSV